MERCPTFPDPGHDVYDDLDESRDVLLLQSLDVIRQTLHVLILQLKPHTHTQRNTAHVNSRTF